MAGSGKGPAQLTAMAISQLRQAFIYAYNNKDYVTAGFYVTSMKSALPSTAPQLDMPPMPQVIDNQGHLKTQDTVKNFAMLKIKPWIDEWYPKVENALSVYIDNFYKNNPRLASLY